MQPVTHTEQAAERADAERRLLELRAVASRLYPDRDDGLVLSELLSVLDQIRQAEAVLKCHD